VADPLQTAVRALGHRELSSAELAAKLDRAGVAALERDEVIARLEGAGYVDDARFAVSRATALAERGRGDEAIRHDLEQRGVPGEVVAAALASLAPEAERAKEVAERLGGGLRAARTLARNGFAADSIEVALPAVASET
jgi:regulatory protein